MGKSGKTVLVQHDSQRDSSRPVALDGSQVDGAYVRRRWTVNGRFADHHLSLPMIESVVHRRLHRQVRRAVRAQARLATFRRELHGWRAALKSWRAAGKPLADRWRLNRRRPSYFAPDAHGQYTQALKDLRSELDSAWPRRRRKDKLRTEVLKAVRAIILTQLYARDPSLKGAQLVVGRPLERGVDARVNRLTTDFLTLHYPSLFADLTADRLRRRPSLSRRAK